MTLRDAIELILDEFPAEREKTFKGNSFADLVRNQIPSEVIEDIDSRAMYSVDASVGKGNWASVPWIGIFNDQITDSAQRGYYIVYLFLGDGSGFYISLNQGITEVREQYKSSAKNALTVRAKDYVARLGFIDENWITGEINLKCDEGGLGSYYGAGNVVAKFYNVIPSDESLKSDLGYLIGCYEKLFFSDLGLESQEEEDEYFEDKTTIRFHKRIERNGKLAKAVKKRQGYVCRGCGLDMASGYADCGASYIEAHHLTPISQLTMGKIKLDPDLDFTVLCPNCHRMIHRSQYVGNVESFKVHCVRVQYVS